MPTKFEKPLVWQGLRLAKRGHTLEEYEDALAGDPERGRFAVADGASESSFAGLWAQLLVDGFVHHEKQEAETNWLAPLQKRWAAEVDGRPLAWYAEAKRAEGAFATLLGLVLKRSQDASGGRWRAAAIGDSCLFQIHKDRLVHAFPVTRADAFGDRPSLISSRPSSRPAANVQQQDRGTWRIGDQFLLMTDALAQWFLQQHEAEHKPWHALDTVLKDAHAEMAFASWIEQLRHQGRIRNDDVTVVAIRM